MMAGQSVTQALMIIEPRQSVSSLRAGLAPVWAILSQCCFARC